MQILFLLCQGKKKLYNNKLSSHIKYFKAGLKKKK